MTTRLTSLVALALAGAFLVGCGDDDVGPGPGVDMGVVDMGPVDMAAGHRQSLYIQSDGTLWTSGWNIYGKRNKRRRKWVCGYSDCR